MRGLRAKLQSLTHAFASEDGPTLPPDILDALADKDAPPVLHWLQESVLSQEYLPNLSLLREAASQAGWVEFDIGRLEAFAYLQRGDLTEAMGRADGLLTSAGFAPDLFQIIIACLYRLGHFEEAYLRVHELGDREGLFAEDSNFHISVAAICLATNQVDEARRYVKNALAIAPDDTTIAINAYLIFFDLGDMDTFQNIRQAFVNGRYDVDHDGAVIARTELAQDHYVDGFRLMERRYTMKGAKCFLNPSLFNYPRWQGESLCDQTLLVSAEQGLGDTIQMARFLGELASLCPIKPVLEVQPEALALLRFNFPQIEIIERKFGTAPSVAFDRWTGMMSLPHHLGISEDTIPGCAGYLAVSPESQDYWRERVAELSHRGKPNIGLAWSGRATHRDDRRRSIPFARMMEAIRPIDANFFALQTHVPGPHPSNLIDVSEEMLTLADTAALIAEMDLVITVDTSVVHLAGSIAKETWLLLPYRYEWRWSLEGEQNRWYDSVKVLRQPTHGDWDSVLNDVFGRRLIARGWSN